MPSEDMNLQQAEAVIKEAELAGLLAVQAAMTAYDAALVALVPALPGQTISNALRIINEVRANQAYRIANELPQLIQNLQPAPAVDPVALVIPA